MDFLFILSVLLSFAACMFIHRALKPNPWPWKSPNLPPGPKSLPIIGNILELTGPKPHQSLAKLAKIYGPLMRLKLGGQTAIVVSSREVAKIMFQKHDQVFCNRPIPDAIRALDIHKLSVAWLPVDHQWRKLRKICKENMFSVQRLDASQGLRREKLKNLCDYVSECCDSSQAVDIGKAAFTTSINLISTTLFSVDFAAFGSDSSQELRGLMSEIVEIAGRPNLADFFPVFGLVDPQGIVRNLAVCLRKIFEIFDDVILERLRIRGESSDYMSKNDMLEALLDLNQKNDSELSIDDVKHLLLDLFTGGTHTVSGTMEWIMAELVRNPEKMLKAKDELKNVVGHDKQVQELDISRLPYLRSVVKETLRLHPSVPLLVPHKADKDIEINGYLVPRNAQILVNVWAIGKDPSIWSDPDSFMPERFLELETDFRGGHFELIPFGAGRRICLGLPLAHRIVHLMVATLISNFDWKLESGLKNEELDMDEKFAFSFQKAIPLKAVPIKL